MSKVNQIADEILKEASFAGIAKGVGRTVGGAMIGATLGANKGLDTNKNAPHLSEDGQAKNLATGAVTGALIGGAALGPGVGLAKKGLNAIKNIGSKIASSEKLSEMEVPTEDEKKKENNEVSE